MTPEPTVGAVQLITAPWLRETTEVIVGALAEPDATNDATELYAPAPFALTVAIRKS